MKLRMVLYAAAPLLSLIAVGCNDATTDTTATPEIKAKAANNAPNPNGKPDKDISGGARKELKLQD